MTSVLIKEFLLLYFILNVRQCPYEARLLSFLVEKNQSTENVKKKKK